MPLEQVPDTPLQYYLINFDASGQERNEPDGTKMSQTLLEVLAQELISDVFIISHGWLGDIPAARRQYNKWIQAMAANTADIEALKQVRPNFKPLLIGLHWPSLPWGNEDLADNGASTADDAESNLSREGLIERYAKRIADTPIAKKALGIIFDSGEDEDNPEKLPPEIIQAYADLNGEAGLGSAGEAGAPGEDREPFDPAAIYTKTTTEDKDYSPSHFSLNRLLSPLRSLSYWKMKERARQIGETGGAQLLQSLQSATSEAVRFHLVGHSFGCIVMSASLAGAKGNGQLVRPVNSLSLIQGAVSLWSYCAEIPVVSEKRPGYFHSILADRRVNGPILTTRSEYDTAVGRLYPLASGIARSDPNFADMNEQPRYGAIGAYGALGGGIEAESLKMLPCDQTYAFEVGKIYNLEASKYICKIPPDAGLGGAHSAIDEPEVAHAVWSASLVQ
ncbi:hypothetical protein H6F87_24785 [Cyanobacteria bacterium FACHB-502]|nr:hypothetical protein [Cyanobacteria bacterium FACHB-502]